MYITISILKAKGIIYLSMYYTDLYKNLRYERNLICRPETPSESKAKKSITYFSYQVLGIKPYTYQHQLFKASMKEKRIIICKSRQIGISTGLEIIALQAAIYNLYPSSIYNNTKIGMISRADKASKKLMGEIKSLTYLGDRTIEEKSGGKVKKYLSSKIAKARDLPNNRSEITFDNGNTIKCYPPTDACRGEPFDILIVDEARDVDEEIYLDAMIPTVSKTKGSIILSSTPKGQHGMFFQTFDPFDVYKEHDYKRYWYYWKQCEDNDQKKVIRNFRKQCERVGNMRHFDQEYNALFTVDQTAFLNSTDVDNGIDWDAQMEYSCQKFPCSLAIDYGMADSATTLTVKAKQKNTLRTIWQFGEFGMDINKLTDDSFEHSVPNLMKRYNLGIIVVDDCPQGYQTNKALEDKGFPIKKFNFRSDQVAGERNRGYFMYRGALKMGRIKYPKIMELIAEMKCLQEVSLKVCTRISAPQGANDDRIDGEMMASYPFLEEEIGGSFESEAIAPEIKKEVDWNDEKLKIRGDRELSDNMAKWTAFLHEDIRKEIGG